MCTFLGYGVGTYVCHEIIGSGALYKRYYNYKKWSTLIHRIDVPTVIIVFVGLTDP